MKHLQLIFLSVLLLSCETQQQSGSRSWHGSMHGLADSLNEIMPDLIARSPFDTKLEKKQMDRALKSLQSYADNLDNKNVAIPSRDPSLRFLAQDFKNEMKIIAKASHNQSLTKTRAQVQRLTNYCIACHTRSKATSSFYSGNMGESIEGYSDYGKARFYTAVRQYEKAMIHYEKALTDKNWGKANTERWNHTAMALLVLTVRVQENPNLTIEMISRLFDTKVLPPDMEKPARVWRQDAKSWEKEKSKNYELQKVQELLTQAAQKDVAMKYSGLLLYLRASKVLNKILDQGTLQGERQQRYLFYSGLVAKRMARLNFVGFPETHFKACMSLVPNSKTAAQCKAELN